MRTACLPKIKDEHLDKKLKKIHDYLDVIYEALDEEDYDYAEGRVDKALKEVHMLRKKLE